MPRDFKDIERFANRPAVLFLVVLLFVLGAVGLAQSRPPHGDEGHFASCAYEFAHNGRLACPMWTEWLPSLDRCMYVTMPLYFIQLGAVSLVTGYDISALRLDSVAWGVLLVLSCYAVVAGLTRDRFLALVALILVALNYDVMNLASGRYDPMCAALNMAGIAAYVSWREHNLARAVLFANCLLATSCVTHPYAIFGMAGFAVLFAMLDLRRLSPRLILIAAAPYVVTLGAWGVYVAQDPTAFRQQMADNAGGRLRYLTQPIAAFRTDISLRYVEGFAGFRDRVPIYMRVKALLLLAYLAGFVACLATPSIRRNRERLSLVMFGIVSALLLTFAEGNRWYIYLIHALPLYSIVLAIWTCHLLRGGGLLRKAAVAGIAAFCLYSFVTVAYRVRVNEYRNLYQPTLEYLAAHIQGGELMMGPPEFGPRLGFRQHCLDDASLGFRNGLHPDYVVVDLLMESGYSDLAPTDPKLLHVRAVLAQSDLVYQREGGANYYRVYRVRHPAQALR